MKTQLLFVLCLLTLPVFAGKTAHMDVNWTFMNVNEGYDHQNKIAVYVDGNLVGESNEFAQTAKAKYGFDLPMGKHTVKILNYAFYEGKWEEHTKANGYSVDAFYENVLTISKGFSVNMVFDIATELTEVKVVGAKTAAPVGTQMTVSWTFKNVQEGFDHNNRIAVYCDDKLLGYSDTYLETAKGTYSVVIPSGTHTINIINEAYYEGTWEAHTIENNYSIDAIYSTNMTFGKKKRSMTLIWDLNDIDSKFTVK